VQTPNLDRLAARSTVFDNCFVTTSICAVSRASIFTGQWMRRHGIVDFATPFTERQWRETYPALLRAAGYRTGFIGKFGVGSNAAVKAMSGQFDYWRGLPDQGGLFYDKNDPNTHKTARFGGQALEFLRECGPGRPFCLSVSFNAPHARDRQPREFWPDARDEALYTDVTIPHPAKFGDEWFAKLPEFVQQSEGRRRWSWRFTNELAFQCTVKDYYRLVTGIDREVGRILEALDDRGLAGNTVVLFTSDNGFFLGERGLADKWLPYEESIRVPLVVFDPRLDPVAQASAPASSRTVPVREPESRGSRPEESGSGTLPELAAGTAALRGAVVDAMTLNIDLAPTLLDLARVRAPKSMQGRSLVPLLEGKSPRGWRKEFFYEHHTLPDIIPPTEGVRTEKWKYFRYVDNQPVVEELYDLANDPDEERNLAADPNHAKPLTDLRARWSKLSRQLK